MRMPLTLDEGLAITAIREARDRRAIRDGPSHYYRESGLVQLEVDIPIDAGKYVNLT
jgi:hypothetical protein